jgi:hypothetical protein
VQAHPLDLVLVRALELAAAQDLLDDLLDAVVHDLLRHLLLLLLGDLRAQENGRIETAC